VKIGFIGPVCNTMYIMASCFRAMGHDAHYYNIWSSFMFSQPFWEDGEYFIPYEKLSDAREIERLERHWQCPEWLITHRESLSRLRYNAVARLFRSTGFLKSGHLFNLAALKELCANIYPYFVQELKTCDFVVTTGVPGILACYEAGVAYVFIPHGQDARDATGAGECIHFESTRNLLSKAIAGAILCGSQGSNMNEILQRLCGKQKVVTLPKIVNSEVYCSRQVEPNFPFLPERVNDILRERDRIVLLMYSRYSDRWKGTGLFIEAFSNVARRYPERLFMITSGWGEDCRKYMDMMSSDAALGECVYCMEGAVSKGYLRMLLNSVDVAVDQFLLGWYGSTFVEAASCGRMVLINLDRDRWDEYVEMEFPPVRDCSSAERIEEVLEALAKGEIDPRREGIDFERWIQRNHGMEKLVPRLLGLVEERL